MSTLQDMIETECVSCEAAFTISKTKLWPSSHHCPTCAERIAQEEREQEEKGHLEIRIERWNDIIPPRYRSTDTEHEEFHKGLWQRVASWEPTEEKPWLGIVGPNGSSKTRVSALRTRMAMVSEYRIDRKSYGHVRRSFKRITEPDAWSSERPEPRSTCPLFVTSYQFAEAVRGQYESHTKEDAKALLTNCRDSHWLVFDDIGKAKATPAVVAELFALIDHRHAENLVTIWTANSRPEEFCAGMGADVEGPLVRRLVELSTLLALK